MAQGQSGSAIYLEGGKRIVGKSRGFFSRLAFGSSFDLHRSAIIIAIAVVCRWRNLDGLRRVRPFLTPRVLGALITRQRADHLVNSAANHLGLKIRMTVGLNFVQKSFDDLKAKFGMGHFTSPEFQGDLDLHVLAEEIDGMLNLHPQIMWIDLRAELNFFDLVGVLMLL